MAIILRRGFSTRRWRYELSASGARPGRDHSSQSLLSQCGNFEMFSNLDLFPVATTASIAPELNGNVDLNQCRSPVALKVAPDEGIELARFRAATQVQCQAGRRSDVLLPIETSDRSPYLSMRIPHRGRWARLH